MFSSSMLLLSICLLFFFVAQMPSSMIAGMPTKSVDDSLSASNSKSQFSDVCLIMDDVFNFSRNDNKSRAIFDKMKNLDEQMEKCRQQGGGAGGECKNETLIKEANQLLDPFFDVFDKNKDAQLDAEEIEKMFMDGVAYVGEKTCIEEGAIIQDPKNHKKLNELERKYITKKMKEEVLSEIKKEGKEMAAKMVEKFDANKNGKLNKKEMEEGMKKEVLALNVNGSKTMKKFKRFAPMTMGAAHSMKFDRWFK